MKTFSEFLIEKVKLFGLQSQKRFVGPVNPARPFSGYITPNIISKKHGVMGQRKLS